MFMRGAGNLHTSECPSMPEEDAEFCYMAVLSEKAIPEAEEAVSKIVRACHFLSHIDICESCRAVFKEVRTYIDAIRNTSGRRHGIQLVKRKA
jgi:hypothetical protein